MDVRARDASAEAFSKRSVVATRPWLLVNFISLLACLAAAAVGLGVTPGIEKSAVIWPGSGVALAALLIFGNGVWPGILLANLLVLTALGVPTAVVLATSGAATAGPAIAVWALRRLGVDLSLRGVRDALRFGVISCLQGAFAAPVAGVALLVGSGTLAVARAGNVWADWAMADCVSALSVTPFLLWLYRPDRAARARSQALGFMASTAILIFATAWCYSLSPPVGYPILLVVMLIAVRYSQLEVSIAVLCVVAIALCKSTYRDWLPFSGAAPTLLRVMDFLVVLGAGSLLLGSLVAESRLKDRLLLRANQDRLRQSETRFELAFQASTQGMAVTALDGRWLRVNAALCQILGYSEAELLSMNFQSITHPEDLGYDQEVMRAMLAGEAGRQFEKRYIHKSGKVIVVQLSVSLVRDAAGAPLNHVVQVMDITDRKRAEELWRFGLDNAGDVMWDWDIPAGTLVFSGKIRELLDCPDEEVPKTADAWRALIHPDDATRARDETAALLELPPRPYARQYRVRCTGGSYKWIYSRGLVMSRDRDDRPLRAVGTIVDITDVRNLQEKLLQTDKMAALGQLTGGVAHDVNNDLGIIVGSAELIYEQAAAGSREAVLSTRIIATVQRCRDLVRRMLAFSRQADIAPEPLELAGFLKGFIETLGRTLGSHIAIRLHAAPAAVHWVSLDRGMLESCLINLSINARDAMPNGGVLTMALDAQPGAAQEDGMVLLTVTDTGTGMSEAVRQRLFEPFFTTKPAGSGVGLGLAMVYGFVQQSGGGIEVESKLGIGTRFLLRFPAAALPEEKAPNPGQPVAAAGAARTILLVDDNDALRVTLREQLAALKCTTHEAATFEQAVCVLRSVADIDFIISDFDLGDGPDGVQLARWADQNGYGGPGALISGHPRHFAGLPENWHVLQKPIQLGDLKKLLSPGVAAAANGQEARPGLSGSPLHPAGSFVPAILVVEDNDDMRFIAVEILKRGGYTILEAANAGEALEKLEQTPAIMLVLSDLGLPDMHGTQLAQEIRRLYPRAGIALMSGTLSSSEFSDQAPRGDAILRKPFTAESLANFVSDALARASG